MALLAALAARLRRTGAGAVVALAALVPATVAAAGVLESQLAENRSQQRQIRAELQVNDRKQQQINRAIDQLNVRINSLDVPIAELNSEIAALEARIAQRNARIEQLRAEFRRQKVEIERLDAELGIARERLSQRLVEIYVAGEPGYAQWFLSARSMGDLLAREDVAGRVAQLDSEIVRSISDLERRVRVRRARNHYVRQQIAADIRAIAADQRKTEQARAVLLGKQQQLEGLRAERDQHLNRLESREAHLDKRYDSLEEQSDNLRQAIENGYTTWNGSVPSGPSPAGLVWPVSGPVVSPFGMRWGRMHEGIDIAVPSGTPIHASAAGVVTHSGWMSGYGNLVIVQHGGGLSTSYAHQSRIGASNGQFVQQGQVIGYVGCTGHCYGDHVHFETRVNGTAVDPMRYL